MLVNLNTKRTVTLVLKELGTYLNNSFGYVSVFIFISFVNFMFVKDLFVISDGSMRQFFEMLAWPLLIYVPLVGGRIISDEKKSGTIELLMALPITTYEIVIAKFIALLAFCAITLSLTFVIPIILGIIASPHIPTIIVSYIGVTMLVIFISAVTVFFSSITSSQVAASFLSILVVFCFYVIGTDFISNTIPSSVRNVIIFASPLNQLSTYYKGVIDLYSVVYFLSVSSMFLISGCVYTNIKKI